MREVMKSLGILLAYFIPCALAALALRRLVRVPHEVFRKILHMILLGSLSGAAAPGSGRNGGGRAVSGGLRGAHDRRAAIRPRLTKRPFAGILFPFFCKEYSMLAALRIYRMTEVYYAGFGLVELCQKR